MSPHLDTRRSFLVRTASGLGSSWIALHWPAVVQAHEHARTAAAGHEAKFDFLSSADAGEIEAMAEQIIPGDAGSPGAREAAVIYFIDHALMTFDRERQAIYKEGLAMLQTRTQETFPGSSSFSKLTSEQQVQLLSSIESTDFFETVRVHTIMGFLADPTYGGNRGLVGWKLIGFEQKPAWTPPFGYYDEEANR